VVPEFPATLVQQYGLYVDDADGAPELVRE
jgi:hypothetical protein